MITLRDVSSLMAHYDKRGEYIAADAMLKLLHHGLPPQQKEALKLVRRKWVATPEICKTLGVKPNHGAMIMSELHKLRLVTSRPRTNGQGNEWIERNSPIQEGE